MDPSEAMEMYLGNSTLRQYVPPIRFEAKVHSEDFKNTKACDSCEKRRSKGLYT